MGQVERRFRLIIDQGAAADLIQVRASDPRGYASIVAMLQEYDAGSLPVEELIDEYFTSDEIENIKPFWHLQNKRFNVYRVKLVSVHNWRILTAGDRKHREVAVLAVMHRNQNYQADSQLIDRITKSYETLGFHHLGR